MTMKSRTLQTSFFKGLKPVLLLVFLWFVLSACGIYYSVDGQVVDAKTGEPIEGAVVAVNWSRTKILGVPGYNALTEHYGTFEDVTDATGTFTIPKFLIGYHYMGVYKNGYICWSSETIFKPEGKDWKEMFKRRYDHRVTGGMIVKLESKGENFPEEKHARFVMDVGTALSSPTPKFNNSTDEEYIINMDSIRRQMKERENEK